MIHNLRSHDQWGIVSAAADFDGKHVIDFGCGHADLLLMAYMNGALSVIGIEKDIEILSQNRLKFREAGANMAKVLFLNWDLHDPIWNNISGIADIGICFSVLPYLDNQDDFLYRMSKACDISFVECQYAGDGPGTVRDQAAMASWLQRHWGTVECVGRTLVTGRDKWRDIWMCK